MNRGGPPPAAWRQVLARAGYTLLLALLLPAVLLRWRWRARREPLYGQHWNERLGRGDAGVLPGRVWLHAVSLGETRAAAPLVAELRRRQPGLRLLLTHGTATGRAAGAALLEPGDLQCWLPYDLPGAVGRFLRRHRPALGLVMETEVWPNLMHAAAAQGVPMVLVNARLSARSLARGQRLRTLLQPALASFTRVLAQTRDDAQRLRAGGAGTVDVMGNLKYDLAPDPVLLQRGSDWRRVLARPVVLAAVTREGEEAPLLAAWAALAAPRPLLLLVPRHPQRFDEVAALAAGAGLRTLRRSGFGGDSPPAVALDADVWLGDSVGEMPLYYGCADVALLGGSYAPLGGQNLIEAAACGCPLLIGPHTFNFAEAAELSLAAGASERVPTVEAAVRRAVELAADAAGRSRRDAMAAHALAFAAQHRGAAGRMAAVVCELLARQS